MDNSHSNLIILDGISGGGKTTLKHALNRAREYQDYHIHRFTATEWVYATLNRRPVNLEKLRRDEEKMQKIWRVTHVTVVCDPYIALQRKQSMPNEVIEQDIAIANKLFLVYHNYLTVFKRKLVINTNLHSIDECVQLILNRL